jgi:hypothetical protein
LRLNVVVTGVVNDDDVFKRLQCTKQRGQAVRAVVGD